MARTTVAPGLGSHVGSVLSAATPGLGAVATGLDPCEFGWLGPLARELAFELVGSAAGPSMALDALRVTTGARTVELSDPAVRPMTH